MHDSSVLNTHPSVEWLRCCGGRGGCADACTHACMQAPRPADMAAVHLVRFGDVFVDDRSGWLHVCDGSCDLQRPDDAGAFMVCPVTGRMHGRVPETWEGGACGGGDGGGLELDGDPPVGGAPLPHKPHPIILNYLSRRMHAVGWRSLHPPEAAGCMLQPRCV